MTPRVKVFAGVILLIPAIILSLWSFDFQFSNPGLTETQLFNEIGWVPFALMVIALPSALLISAGVTEDEEEDR